MNSLNHTFDAFLHSATGGHAPYAYQRRLASDTPGRPCGFQLTSPTSRGKTAV